MKLNSGSVDGTLLGHVFPWSLHRDFPADPDRQLIESIERYGLLRPLIVREKRDNCELVCGARRLEALRRCGKDRKISCLVADRSTSDRDLLELVVEDQDQSGPLSPIETAYLIELWQNIDRPLDQKTVQDATGTRSETECKRLLSLLELEKPLILAVHHGALSVKIGLALRDLPPEQRIFIFDLFKRLSLNTSKQRRALELARIISVTQGISLDEVFTNHFPEVCTGSVDNVPQSATRMLKKLHELSHPRLSAARKNFNEKVQQLRLPDRCTLEPWPSFEREAVSLTTEFEDFESFQKAWQKIKDLI